MTDSELEQFDDLKNKILNAEDRVEVTQLCENDIFGIRPLIVEITSESIGHMLRITYIYADAYNNQGVLGGRSQQSVTYEVI